MEKNLIRLTPRRRGKSESQGPLLESRYGLVENQNISHKWLYIQTFFYICAAVSGFLCAYTLRAFRNIFADSCLLNIELNSREKDGNNEVQAVFGSSTSCDFCEFVPVVSSISALVLALYFIMSGRGGKGSPGFLPRPWRIVLPALLFNVIALICVAVATTMLHNGLQRFCDQLLVKQAEMSGTSFNGTTTDIDVNGQHGFSTLSGCRVDLNTSTTKIPEIHNPLHAFSSSNYMLLEISQLASWGNVISWTLCVFITLLRFLCMADFDLVRFEFVLVTQDVVKAKPGSSSTMGTAEDDPAEYVLAVAGAGEGNITEAVVEEGKVSISP